MDFFGIGPMELLLILIVALLVFGPNKIVEIGRTLGKTVHSFRKAASDFTEQISKEVEAEKKPPHTQDKNENKAALPGAR